MDDSMPGSLPQALTTLAEVVYARADYEDVYAAICRTAVDVIPGCDHACVSVLRGGSEMVSFGATAPVASKIDAIEAELREGPCYDAITSEAFQMDSDLTVGSTWPALAERVLAETPVRGMIGYRVLVGPRKAGALNLFSETPGALTEESANLGAVVAAFTSVALGAAAEHERAETLLGGLHSNREIGKATGILMATHGIDDEEAFSLLRRTSQTLNQKLAQVARRVIDEHRGSATDGS